MRSIVLGAIVAAGLSLVSAVPTVSAPANVAAIGQAAADIGTVSQVRCWCTWRGMARLLPALALLVMPL